MQWVVQYGRPGTPSASQKRKPGLPGSPMGQQQGAERVPHERTNGAVAADRRRSGVRGDAAVTSVDVEISEGNDGRLDRCGGVRRGFGVEPLRMGDRRSGKSRRCALPTIAFLLTPKRRPISAVLWPSSQSDRSRPIATSVQSKLLVMSFSCAHGAGPRVRDCAAGAGRWVDGSMGKCWQG
jgi:hypothetical protein